MAETFPHADCAVCLHWGKDGKCRKGRDPAKMGPYQKCWWCNTREKDRKRPGEAETGKLFFGRG